MAKRSVLSEATGFRASRGGLSRAALRALLQGLPKGPSVPVTLSLLVHAGLVVVAAHHAGVLVDIQPARAATELPAPDLVDVDVSTPEQPSSSTSALRIAHAAPRAPLARAARQESTPNAREPRSEPAAAPDSNVSPESTGARFAMTIAPTTGVHSALSSASAAGASAAVAAPIAESAAEMPARLESGSDPSYPASALSAGVEAEVPLEIVVNEAGTVISARAPQPVGYGLDDVAIASVRSYHFRPARRGDKAVAVRMRWLMRFQLR